MFCYVPMALFLLFLLFPFYWMVITSMRPDGELYRPWNSDQLQSVLDLETDLGPCQVPVRGDAVLLRGYGTRRSSRFASTAISLVCGVFAGCVPLSAELSDLPRNLAHPIFITYLVPRIAFCCSFRLAEISTQLSARATRWSADSDLSDLLFDSGNYNWIKMGYFKACTTTESSRNKARIDGSPRWHADALHRHPVAIPQHPLPLASSRPLS